MDVVCEIACSGNRSSAAAIEVWFDGRARQALAQLPGLVTLDVYRMEEGAYDPFNDDGAGPLLLIVPAFGSREALAAALPGINDAVGDLPAGVAATATALERHFYAIEGKPAPLRAPFSYVVRYHRPAEDEARFVANYVATHPPTLATLPGIRSVMCYFPQDDIRSDKLASAGYMIGNEVAFDDVAAFNIAMQSPVRQELRAHFREFPPFTGRNTHYPMRRSRLIG